MPIVISHVPHTIRDCCCLSSRTCGFFCQATASMPSMANGNNQAICPPNPSLNNRNGPAVPILNPPKPPPFPGPPAPASPVGGMPLGTLCCPLVLPLLVVEDAVLVLLTCVLLLLVLLLISGRLPLLPGKPLPPIRRLIPL